MRFVQALFLDFMTNETESGPAPSGLTCVHHTPHHASSASSARALLSSDRRWGVGVLRGMPHVSSTLSRLIY